MANLTRHRRSIVLAFTAGLWGFSLDQLAHADIGLQSAGYSLMLLLFIPVCALCWLTPAFESGPTTRPTTATLLRTRAWRSRDSRTASSGFGSRSRE